MIDEFINGKVCVHCKNISEIESFLKLCESKNLKWFSCPHATYQMPTILEEIEDLYFFYEDYFKSGEKFLTYSYTKESDIKIIEFSQEKNY